MKLDRMEVDGIAVQCRHTVYACLTLTLHRDASLHVSQLKKATSEAAEAALQAQVLDQALKTLEAGDQDVLKQQYIDAVRKTAVVQVGSTVNAASWGCYLAQHGPSSRLCLASWHSQAVEHSGR